MNPIDVCALVLVLAAGIGCLNHLCLRLPRSIGVLVLSLTLSFLALAVDRLSGLHLVQWYHTTIDAADLPRIFLDGTLALLLFASSLHVNARELSRRKWTILTLATGSVIVSTVVFGAGIWLAFRFVGIAIPPAWCFVIGAILAPTDAVVAESLLRQMPIPPALRAAITGESLFNDGAALVLYLAMLGLTEGRTGMLGHGHFLIALLSAIGGGALIGAAGGSAASWLMRRVNDAGLQLLVSIALVIASYRAADAVQVSAPIAVVTAGLCVKLLTPDFSAGTRQYSTLAGFWGLLDELLDTILFLLIGFQVLALALVGQALAPIALAMPLALLARLLSVVVPVGLSRGTMSGKLRDAAVLTWAGMRGGISVALALTLPPTPYRVELLSVCYAVVLFTIVVQGLTMTPLLRILYGRQIASAPAP
jgi:monovalent cation:H+ antiporter, CPA1 family